MAAAVGGAAAEEAVMAGSEMTFERFLAVDDVTVTGGGGVMKKKRKSTKSKPSVSRHARAAQKKAQGR